MHRDRHVCEVAAEMQRVGPTSSGDVFTLVWTTIKSSFKARRELALEDLACVTRSV